MFQSVPARSEQQNQPGYKSKTGEKTEVGEGVAQRGRGDQPSLSAVSLLSACLLSAGRATLEAGLGSKEPCGLSHMVSGPETLKQQKDPAISV